MYPKVDQVLLETLRPRGEYYIPWAILLKKLLCQHLWIITVLDRSGALKILWCLPLSIIQIQTLLLLFFLLSYSFFCLTRTPLRMCLVSLVSHVWRSMGRGRQALETSNMVLTVWGIHLTSQSSSILLLSQFENETVFRRVCANVERNKTPGRLIHWADFRVGTYPVSGPRLVVGDLVSEWVKHTYGPQLLTANRREGQGAWQHQGRSSSQWMANFITPHSMGFGLSQNLGMGCRQGNWSPRWLSDCLSYRVRPCWAGTPGMGSLTPSLEMLRPEDHIASLLVSQLVYLKRTSSFWTW